MSRTAPRFTPADALWMPAELKLDLAAQTLHPVELRSLRNYYSATNALSVESRVIDMGCGTAYGCRILSDKVAKVIGWDINQNALKVAHSWFEDVETQRIDLDEPWASIAKRFSVNAITAFNVIESLKHPHLFLQQCVQALPDNGVLCLSLFSIQSQTLRYSLYGQFSLEYSHADMLDLLGRYFGKVVSSDSEGDKDIIERPLGFFLCTEPLR